LDAPTHHLVGDHGEKISMDWFLKELGLWNASMVQKLWERSRQDYFMGKGRGF